MDFRTAVSLILMYEGGYVFDPRDPGGETRYGISKRAFPNEDIKNLTVERAKEIYKKYYWDMCECDRLPDWSKLIVFDCAVNQGAPRAKLFIQRTASVEADSIIGPRTLAAMYQMTAHEFISDYSMRRFKAYFSNPNWKYFGGGWSKRLLEVVNRSYQEIKAQ